MGDVHYMISEAAKQVNMEPHVMRHWEEELDLHIGRTEMGHRYYTEEDIRVFRCVKELKEQGMTLRELKDLLPEMLRAREKRQKKKQPLSEWQMALLENNCVLQEVITKALSEELSHYFQTQELQEEERYKKLDALIRQQQIYRKQYAKKDFFRDKVNSIEKYLGSVLY